MLVGLKDGGRTDTLEARRDTEVSPPSISIHSALTLRTSVLNVKTSCQSAPSLPCPRIVARSSPSPSPFRAEAMDKASGGNSNQRDELTTSQISKSPSSPSPAEESRMISSTLQSMRWPLECCSFMSKTSRARTQRRDMIVAADKTSSEDGSRARVPSMLAAASSSSRALSSHCRVHTPSTRSLYLDDHVLACSDGWRRATIYTNHVNT